MSVSREDIEHLSKLARIELSSEEIEGLDKDINNILGYVEQVARVEVLDASPTIGDVYNILRDDEGALEAGAHTKELLEAAPEVAETEKGTYIKVPKIL